VFRIAVAARRVIETDPDRRDSAGIFPPRTDTDALLLDSIIG